MITDPENRDRLILECTGRELYANRGIVGLGPDLDPTEGLDGGFHLWNEDGKDKPFTDAERAELADFMIARWQEFKTNGPKPFEWP